MTEVSCGIILNGQDQVLLARRAPHKSNSGLWEFPGGKLHPGESPAECLHRELWEELKIKVAVNQVFREFSTEINTANVVLIPNICHFRFGEFQLTDHDAYSWVKPSGVASYPLLPADLEIWEQLQTTNYLPGND